MCSYDPFIKNLCLCHLFAPLPWVPMEPYARPLASLCTVVPTPERSLLEGSGHAFYCLRPLPAADMVPSTQSALENFVILLLNVFLL